MSGVDVGVVNGIGVRVGVCTGVNVGMGVLSDGGVFTQPDKKATANMMKKNFSIVVKMNPQLYYCSRKYL